MGMKIFLGFVVALVLISGCSEKDICNVHCKNLGYDSGKCNNVPNMLNPCEIIGEITVQSDVQLCEIPESSLSGSGISCCCRGNREVLKSNAEYCN